MVHTSMSFRGQETLCSVQQSKYTSKQSVYFIGYQLELLSVFWLVENGGHDNNSNQVLKNAGELSDLNVGVQYIIQCMLHVLRRSGHFSHTRCPPPPHIFLFLSAQTKPYLSQKYNISKWLPKSFLLPPQASLVTKWGAPCDLWPLGPLIDLCSWVCCRGGEFKRDTHCGQRSVRGH